MAIDKPLEPFTEQELSDAFGAEDPDEIEVEIEQPLGDEEDDGSLIVQLSEDGEVLDDMYEDHDANMPYLSIDPIFDDMRDDPRFVVLLKKIGLR